MRKTARKLTLSRETLRHLQQPELDRIAGGTGSAPWCTGPYMCSVTDCSAVCLVANGCASTGNTQCC